MNTAVINIKVNPSVKKGAQLVAEELGLSLSSVINGFLKQLVRTRYVSFSLQEEPTSYLIDILQESKRDIKAKRVSPNFNNAKDAVNWLRAHKKNYAG